MEMKLQVQFYPRSVFYVGHLSRLLLAMFRSEYFMHCNSKVMKKQLEDVPISRRSRIFDQNF